MPKKGTRTGAVLTCVACGAPFYVEPARLKLGVVTTCSMACRSKAKIAKRPEQTCDQCGETFSPLPHTRARLCSPACRVANLRVPIADRFWPKVNKHGPTPAHCPEIGPCWIWTRSCDRRGYGHYFIRQGARRFAHRVAWMLTNGPIPDGLGVLHHCDNPPCVRPDHLFLGTPADNSADMVRKGREFRGPRDPSTIRRGSRTPQAKTTEEIVAAVRAEYTGKRGEQVALMRKYTLSRSQVQKIVHGQRWQHVTLTMEAPPSSELSHH